MDVQPIAGGVPCGGVLGFWSCPADGRLGYGDGREVAVGITHAVEAEIENPEVGEGLYCIPDLRSVGERHRAGMVLWRVQMGPDAIRFGHYVKSRSRTYLYRVEVQVDGQINGGGG